MLITLVNKALVHFFISASALLRGQGNLQDKHTVDIKSPLG